MQSPPKLFDPHALVQHRQRAHHQDASAWFLHDLAIEQVSEKLSDVNRTFKDVVIIGPKSALWAEKLGLHARCIDDADVLDLTENSCDLILHALCLHWSNDPVGQLVQMRRALRPDGLMLAVGFGGQTLTELRIAFAEAETSVLGGISPRVAPMAEIRSWGGLLQRADFALPVADTHLQSVTYQSALALMQDLRHMGETNALMARQKTFLRRNVFLKALSVYGDNFADGDRVFASFEFIFLTGWAPDASQPKPLKPGSAKTRLADALKVPEKDPTKDL